MRDSIRLRMPAAALLLFCVAYIGCAGNEYSGVIGKFQESVEESREAIGGYYRGINKFERDLYLKERLFADSLEVNLTVYGRNTPVLGQFSEESIQARLDALSLLGVYSERLAELAADESPARLAEGAKLTGERFDSLGVRLRKIDIDPKIGDRSALDYAGPVATILGILGREFLDSKRSAALEKAIQEGAPAVREILDIMERDIAERIKLLQVTGSLQELAQYVQIYNDNRSRMKQAERKRALEDIKTAAEKYLLFNESDPSSLVQGLREAHEALVIYAGSGDRKRDLKRLLNSLEQFKDRVYEVQDAARRLDAINTAGL